MSQWLKNLGHKASHVKMLRPLYDVQLGKLDAPLDIKNYPVDPLSGDGGYGRWIASGQLDFFGDRVPIDMNRWWIDHDFQNSPYFTILHQFDFLKDLKALGGEVGRKTSRDITGRWLIDFEKYNACSWDPSLSAHRLVNWLCAYPYCFETADDDFLFALHSSIFRQYNHLYHCFCHEPGLDAQERFNALWALMIVTSHIPSLRDDHFESWMQLLNGTIEDISNTDGGYQPPQLGVWATIAWQLTILKQSLTTNGFKVPVWLTKRLETGLRALNIFTHGDKSLPNFQASLNPRSDMIDRLTRQNNLRLRKTDLHLPESGYSALRKGRSMLVVNHGMGPHISPNAFEFSYGTHPLIINCGTHLYSPQWQEGLSGINGHSTLIINGVEPDPDLIAPMDSDLESMNGAALWHGTHEGYRKMFQATHTRRLYLDKSGEDCRGEDLVVRSLSTKPLDLTVRFHLHPDLKTSLVKDGGAVLIQMPSGAGWVFEAANCSIRTEPSVYTGRHGIKIRKSTQIVLQAEMPDLSHQIKWAFRRP